MLEGLQSAFGAEVVAVSDLYAGRLERARQVLGAGASLHHDYREIVGRKDVSAVLIAVPDHWHAEIFKSAAQAGKHIYCECPLGHTLEQGAAMVEAAERHQNIVQVGTAQISSRGALARTACSAAIMLAPVASPSSTTIAVRPAGSMGGRAGV